MVEKAFKKVKMLWDAYKIYIGILALIGLSSTAGYHSNNPAPLPVPVKETKCPTVVCACDAALSKHRKEHY